MALFVEIRDRRDRTVEWRVYTGPPVGPLQIVRRTPDRGARAWVPFLVDLDGDRVLLVEFQEQDEDAVRAQVFDPVFGVVPITWADESSVPVAIAGNYAAVVARRPKRLAVVELATGTERVAVPLSGEQSELGVDLAADGRIVASTRAGLAKARPGEAPRTLPGSNGLTAPRLAGDAVAAVDHDRAVVLGADGSRKVLGPPSGVFTDLAADARGVAWLANGCVRYAALAPPVPAPQADDPCPSTEIGLYYIASSPLRGRHVRVPVRCVTAPTATCRGTVLGKLGRRVVARGRFAVPVGTERDVRMRVARATVRRFRRERFGSLIIDARIPDGRIGVGADGSSELTVKVR